jgi:cytosine/adenosine deaminase-related metal-dependent hydrolase
LAENERYAAACQQRGGGKFAAMIGAHASFTMTDESLRGCANLAQRYGVGVHIHVAEDPVDAQITMDRSSCGLIERLHRAGLFDAPGTIFAHGTHLSDADFDTLNAASEHISVAHNPSSNMNNGVGYTPVAKLKRPPQLGTDGIGADMWREARVAEFKSHDASLAIGFGHSLQMLGQSARIASGALGVRLGILESGAAADLVLTNYRPATPLTVENLAGHFLFAMGPEFVRDVMVAGEWRLLDGKTVSCDEPSIRTSAVEVARALYERMPAID